MGAVTERLISAIKAIENPARVGFQSNGTVKSYYDSNGYAIGWGNRYLANGSTVKQSTVITEGEAEILLLDKLTEFGEVVNKAVTSAINQTQFEALVSLVYNIGTGAFRNSTLLKVVNRSPNDFAAISAEFRKWVLVNGSPSNYLKERREKEILLYTGAVAGSGVLIVVVLLALYILRKKRII
jgi:lysozyme